MAVIDDPRAAIGGQPIAGPAPAGVNVRYEPDFIALQDAVTLMDSKGPLAVNWRDVAAQGCEILQNRSKDLLVASYVVLALSRTESYRGLAVGLELTTDMVAAYWGEMEPPARRERARVQMLEWVVQRVTPLFAEQPPKEDEGPAVIAAYEAIDRLQQVLDERLVKESAALGDLVRLLREHARDAERVVAEREAAAQATEKAAADKAAAEQAAAEKAAAEQATAATAPPPSTPPAPPPATPAPSAAQPAAPTAIPAVAAVAPPADAAGIDIALARLQTVMLDVARGVRSADNRDPRGYVLLRNAIWCTILRSPPQQRGRTLLPPPAADRLMQINALQQAGDHAAAIAMIEDNLASAPFWLDAHQLAASSLQALGVMFEAARTAVTASVGAFLKRVPDLLDSSFSDGSPFASEATRQWLAENAGGSGGGAGSAENGAEPAWVSAGRAAREQARAGQVKDGVGLLAKGVAAAATTRERFMWQTAQAEYCLDLGMVIAAMTRIDSHLLIRSVQGCGKSIKSLQNIPAIYDLDPGVMFFSSPSIEQAEEKIATFNRVNQDDRFVAFHYLSLTAIYNRLCPPDDRISHETILQEGETSWLKVIWQRQHDIYVKLDAYRRQLFALRAAGEIPVLFGTHETLRQHATGNMTRLFYARDFNEGWFASLPREEREQRRKHLLSQNRFHRVIVDEVTAHDLLTIHTAETVGWVQRAAEIIGDHDDLAMRYRRFVQYAKDHPGGVAWDEFLAILACRYTESDIYPVSGAEIPFDEAAGPKGIYSAKVGDLQYVKPRSWWHEFHHVTLLTTEHVPTQIIVSLDREAEQRGERQDDRFMVYALDMPDSSRDTMTVELQRSCTKKSLPDLARAYLAARPDSEIITDMVKARVSDFDVTTHARAKGSNDYIDSDIIAFYSNPSPDLFAELGALNTRFSRNDLVRLFYVDQIDQTTGRNRGYRGGKNRDHTAVFPPRLYTWLAPAIASSSSYAPVLAQSLVTCAAGKAGSSAFGAPEAPVAKDHAR